MKNMNKRLISFKNNQRDTLLLNCIDKQGDKSNFVKDAVEFYLQYMNQGLAAITVPQTNIVAPVLEPTVDCSSAIKFMSLDDVD